MTALAVLADVPHRERGWVGDDQSASHRHDDFDSLVTVLFADNGVLPDPARVIGSVLYDGDEVVALRRLGEVFGPLLERLGDVPDADHLAAPEWPEVARLADLALAAMVRRGTR